MRTDRWLDSKQFDLLRGAVAGILSGGSVLASRALSDLFSTMITLFDLGISGLVIYQTTVNAGVLGIQLSWVLAAYLGFAYLPRISIDYLDDIINATGFRILTASGVAYFGILWSQFMGITSTAVSFGLISSKGQGGVEALFGGFTACLLIFGLYIGSIRDERLATVKDGYFDVFERFTVDPQSNMLWRIQALAQPTQTLVKFITATAISLLFVFPCIIIGLLLAVINGFYPIPELLVFAGVIGQYVTTHTRLNTYLPIKAIPDVEFTATDEVGVPSCYSVYLRCVRVDLLVSPDRAASSIRHVLGTVSSGGNPTTVCTFDAPALGTVSSGRCALSCFRDDLGAVPSERPIPVTRGNGNVQ